MIALIVDNIRDNYEIWNRHSKFLPYGTKCLMYHNPKNKIDSIEKYNKLLVSPIFWNCLSDENILIIQHDSALLRTGIEEFYKYDYVGAPWKFQEHGGNGGLSFRKKSAMLKVIDNVPYNGVDNEDIYFSNALKFLGMNLASRDVCENFSCESIFKLGTLGYHAIDKYLTPEQCEQIKNQYNE